MPARRRALRERWTGPAAARVRRRHLGGGHAPSKSSRAGAAATRTATGRTMLVGLLLVIAFLVPSPGSGLDADLTWATHAVQRSLLHYAVGLFLSATLFAAANVVQLPAAGSMDMVQKAVAGGGGGVALDLSRIPGRAQGVDATGPPAAALASPRRLVPRRQGPVAAAPQPGAAGAVRKVHLGHAPAADADAGVALEPVEGDPPHAAARQEIAREAAPGPEAVRAVRVGRGEEVGGLPDDGAARDAPLEFRRRRPPRGARRLARLPHGRVHGPAAGLRQGGSAGVGTGGRAAPSPRPAARRPAGPEARRCSRAAGSGPRRRGPWCRRPSRPSRPARGQRAAAQRTAPPTVAAELPEAARMQEVAAGQRLVRVVVEAYRAWVDHLFLTLA